MQCQVTWWAVDGWETSRCDMLAASHGIALLSSSRTCRHPVFLAYEPSATKRALLGIHLREGVRARISAKRWPKMGSDAPHFVSYTVTVSDLHKCSKIWGLFCESMLTMGSYR